MLLPSANIKTSPKVAVLPASTSRRSTSTVSPSATRYCRGAAAEFLKFFRELAPKAELSIRHDLDASLERFSEAIRRFEIDRCFFARGCGAEHAFAPTAFVWQESAEEKSIRGKSGPDQCGRN